jgi:hypothetical protein
MKSFKEHLTESKKTYPFKVKIAGVITTEQEATLKSLLDKYKVVEFKKSGRTPVQSLPLDFPRHRNVEVNIYEVTVDYPVTGHELMSYLGNGLQINEQNIVVRNPGEPQEEYQNAPEKRAGALLNDSNYSEHPKVNSEEYYGDKYNLSLVKALNDDLKAKRKERGEVIPTEGKGQTTNDLPQNTKSPVAK